MAARQLRPSRLTSHTFDLSDGAQAYALLTSDEQDVLQSALDKVFEFTRNELYGTPAPQLDAAGGS